MPADQLFTVDRLEGTSAMLLDDAGRAVTVPRGRLPRDMREGDVLRVPLFNDAPDWGRAAVDGAETSRRLDEARKQLDELKKQDAGGDVEL